MIAYTPAWAARLVAAFDASGVHRMCMPGDAASGEWLCDAAIGAGAAVARMDVPTSRISVEEARITCSGVRLDGLPMFDSPPTDATGVEGRLVACGESGEIGYLELPPNSASIKGMRFEEIRRKSQHAAIVVATRVSGESLAPINAQYYDSPFGPPVLLVAGMHHAFFQDQVKSGARATVLSVMKREPASSFNVSALIASTASTASTASRSAAPPVVVLTPRTGWWESTAERAGGIVAWLAAMTTAAERARQHGLPCDVHGFATCGHELGHVGLQVLLAQRRELLQPGVRWLHLGANLGCASNTTLIIRAHDPAEAQPMRDALVRHGYPAPLIKAEPMSQASGEARDVVEHGGHVLSIVGNNAHFHAASDRWPANVNAAHVAAIAGAVSEWLP